MLEFNFGTSWLLSESGAISNREKMAMAICLELKYKTSLMLQGLVSREQFRSDRLTLIKAFRELALGRARSDY